MLGVVRPRQDWERLEQSIYYCNAANPDSGYGLKTCMDMARIELTEAEWARAGTFETKAWLADLSAALDMGCSPYATADEMRVAARDYILRMRGRLDWCGEGTHAILLQLGMEGLEERPNERQQFIERYRQVVAAHYGTADREAWIVRALLRGRAPQELDS